ncbi:LysR family transcriptional regulator [Stutzerimonas nitrititolerans]|uniref:LysR family transcriptional regulator n=1 Tax=Stutzerimonas nitrititolerans TaxID=2482751 RepID=A0AA41WF39_9GAMM|nr:LysR family transcriptional regulator [Stutzerimonas nitrititolerans]KRW69274.1 LysR family transcriptional regulator [Pseudomonas sp. TTU2014-066ASC]MCO7544364.1 LysR family transcriptional regulator [Stutzerimonas nitrititolerans]HAQ27596.1 LysR family transcriptional regulator [Pseudomonas sp.]
MAQSKVNDLQAFVAVARDRSFTKAAARLGITPSALSHTMRALEERLGVRLLARTTRNVSTTEAGERLLRSIAPLFDQLAAEVEALGELRDKPAGTIRITCTDDSIEMSVRPMLAGFLREYPDITLEFYVDYGFTNVVEERFDAGIRLGEAISQDMIATRIGPDWRLVVVGAPEYLERNPLPETPYDLTRHACVNIRHRPSGAIYAWEFEKDGQEVTVKVEGQLVFNSMPHVINAAVDGIGLAYVTEDTARPYLADGRLEMILSDWCPYFSGFHLYYPNRRQASPAFSAFVEALRYRG